MNLPYIDNAMTIASGIAIVIPCMLGVMRALDKKVGLFVLLLLLSSLIGWMALNFQSLASGWSLKYEVTLLQERGAPVPEKLMDRYVNDGASNAFAFLFGWVPATLIFLTAYGVARLLIKITTRKT